MDEYSKMTVGFVAQTYKKRDNKFICTEQTFTASDQVDREKLYLFTLRTYSLS